MGTGWDRDPRRMEGVGGGGGCGGGGGIIPTLHCHHQNESVV